MDTRAFYRLRTWKQSGYNSRENDRAFCATGRKNTEILVNLFTQSHCKICWFESQLFRLRMNIVWPVRAQAYQTPSCDDISTAITPGRPISMPTTFQARFCLRKNYCLNNTQSNESKTTVPCRKTWAILNPWLSSFELECPLKHEKIFFHTHMNILPQSRADSRLFSHWHLQRIVVTDELQELIFLPWRNLFFFCELL